MSSVVENETVTAKNIKLCLVLGQFSQGGCDKKIQTVI